MTNFGNHVPDQIFLLTEVTAFHFLINNLTYGQRLILAPFFAKAANLGKRVTGEFEGNELP